MTIFTLLALGSSMVLNGVIVPDTFCKGIAHNGTSYGAYIQNFEGSSSLKTTWSSEVRKGQRVLCGAEAGF